MVDPNTTWADADLRDLIADYPLAWDVTRGAEPGASLLPLLLDLDPAGRPVSLTGHFPRSNPQPRQLQENPEALFLFLGPQGYLFAQGLKDKDWAPTWAFASVRIEATVTFDPALTDAAITRWWPTWSRAGRSPGPRPTWDRATSACVSRSWGSGRKSEPWRPGSSSARTNGRRCSGSWSRVLAGAACHGGCGGSGDGRVASGPGAWQRPAEKCRELRKAVYLFLASLRSR